MLAFSAFSLVSIIEVKSQKRKENLKFTKEKPYCVVFVQKEKLKNRKEKKFNIQKVKKKGKIMRTPNFGQDITNIRGNEDDEHQRQEQIISRLQENGATPVAPIAGKGIIRVVSRCEDAKENSNLGELNDALSLNRVNVAK